jgi:hypothetical protein
VLLVQLPRCFALRQLLQQLDRLPQLHSAGTLLPRIHWQRMIVLESLPMLASKIDQLRDCPCPAQIVLLLGTRSAAFTAVQPATAASR